LVQPGGIGRGEKNMKAQWARHGVELRHQ
jgi:hypothetical protein